MHGKLPEFIGLYVYSGHYNTGVIDEIVGRDKTLQKGHTHSSGPWREPAEAADE